MSKKKSNPLVFDNEVKAATDVEKLMACGYDERSCRDALASTKGNFTLALAHLRSCVDVINDNEEVRPVSTKIAWVNEVPGEWKDKDLGMSGTMGAMSNAETRALWKSPYYIRIGKYIRLKNDTDARKHHDVLYTMTIIGRDGTSWEVTKSLTDFYSFWVSLPFGMGLHSKLHLKTGFPLWKLNSLSLKSMVLGGFRNEMTEEQIEERRVLLENWLRELCLDEDCMTNVPFLTTLQNFIEAEKHQRLPSSSSCETRITSDKMPLPSKKSPLQLQPTPNDLLKWTRLPQHTTAAPFPVPYDLVMSNLPTKIDLKAVLGDDYHDSNANAESITNKDTTLKQLAKDMSRDRVVIQGERYQGVDTPLDDLILAATRSAQKVLENNNAATFTEDSLSELALRALRQISRTESAYISHTALSMAISLENHPDLAIVPESLLAEPLRIHFRIDEEKKAHVPPSPRKGSEVKVSQHIFSNDETVVIPTPSSPIEKKLSQPLPEATMITMDSEMNSSHSIASVVSSTSTNPFDVDCNVPSTQSAPTSNTSPRVISAQPESKAPVHKSPFFTATTRSTSSSSKMQKSNSPKLRSPPEIFSSSTNTKSLTEEKKVPLQTKRNFPSNPPHPASSTPRKHVNANLICDLQASTVFRFTNIMNMHCELQLKVTYCKSIKMCRLPERTAQSDDLTLNSSTPTTNQKEEGILPSARTSFQSSKCFIVLERETRTSSRDWRHDQTL